MTVDKDHLHQVKAIFEEAIDYESGRDRDAFLERACRGLGEIRREVEALLAAHDEEDTFLNHSPVLDGYIRYDIARERIEALESLPSDRIIDGRYEIRRVLAVGGMGVVYEAEQIRPRRRVALKIMRHGFMTGRIQQRFRYEAETLARLLHPHIAQVYDAGVHHAKSANEAPDALPYFAMEYVDAAQPITAYACDHSLSTLERLRLFCDVCDAIQHGHQRGIIHRDIKPANVLVNGAGQVKVIDFGVARVTDSDVAVTTMQTGVGEIIGTVQYMSPEQCGGDPGAIDVRSDVYALGILLYQLVSDELPYEVNGLSIASAVKMVESAEPASLSAVDRRLRGDLEVIADKALAKNADERYQSAGELRDDMLRYLKDEPILARKPSGWVRLTRWMGRHPVWTAAAGTSSVCMVILTLTGVVMWYGLYKPHDFMYGADGGECSLVTIADVPLAHFGDASLSAANVTAQLVDRPAAYGGGRIALVSVAKGDRSTDGQLCAYYPRNLDDPIWSTRRSQGYDPPALPDGAVSDDWTTIDYSVRMFQTAEVFAESPGQEIIAVFNHRFSSPSVIRVMNLRGDVLFEAWHLGFVRSISWWDAESLLVCEGDRHWRDEVKPYGYPGPEWPLVAFAIRPAFETRLGWINEYNWPEEFRGI